MISCHDARIMDFDHGSMKSYGGYDGTQIHDFIGKSMMSYYVQICDECPFEVSVGVRLARLRMQEASK